MKWIHLIRRIVQRACPATDMNVGTLGTDLFDDGIQPFDHLDIRFLLWNMKQKSLRAYKQETIFGP